jgi:photosystem II stability/assembly factor-like uncharacterized protein
VGDGNGREGATGRKAVLAIGVVAMLLAATMGYWMATTDRSVDREPDPDPDPGVRFVWESMDGPPGGGLSVFAQNPFDTDEIYAGAGMGLFRSTDGGRNFARTGSASIRNVTQISFGEDFALVSGDRVWTYEYGTGETREVYPFRRPAWILGTDAYVLETGGEGTELRLNLVRKAGMTATSRITVDREAEPPVVVIKKQVSGNVLHYMIEPLVMNFFQMGDDLLMSVALRDAGGKYEMEHHDVYLIDTVEGTYRTLDMGYPEDTAPTTITVDPEDDQHLVSAGRRRLSGDDKAFPISDLVRESTDGGRTWSQFTDSTEFQATFIKDVDIRDGHVYFTRVSDWILRTDVDDHSAWKRIDMATVGAAGRVAWLEWISFDMVDGDTVYAGLDIESGFTGTLRSIDGMVTWETIAAGVPASQPSNLAICPGDDDTVVTSGNVAHYPHITRDGGRTWQLLMSATTMGDELAYDPHDPDHMVLVSERTIMFESWDGGRTWAELAPSFYGTRIPAIEMSTEDGGTLYASIFGIGISRLANMDRLDWMRDSGELVHSWDHLYGSSDYAYDIELDPDGSGVLYASYSPKIFEDHSSLWKQDPTKEEGEDWTEILRVPGSSGITSIAIDQVEADNMYVGVTGDEGTLYASSDRGENWEVLSEDLTFSTIHEMAIDPTDEDRVYAAPWGGGMWRSTDGGQNWNAMDVPTVSVSAIVIDPGDGDHMWIGDRTGPNVYETPDGGETWHPVLMLDRDLYYRVSSMVLHDDDIIVSVFNIERDGVAVYLGPMSGTTFRLTPTGPVELGGDMVRSAISMTSGDGVLFAASHIEGVYHLDGDEWREVSGDLPEVGFNGVAFDAAGSVYLASGCEVGLQGQPRVGDRDLVNNIYRSPDRGASWEALLHGNPFGAPVKRLVQHPEVPAVLVAGTGNGVWVSPDGGETWRSESEGLGYLQIGSMVMGADTVYVGTLGGGVYAGTFGTDHSITWSPTSGPRPHIFNIQVVLDPQDPNVMYATAYPGGVFRSADGGVTWGECNFALPSFPVTDPVLQGYYSLAIDPTNGSRLFLGVYGHGVYVSRDSAATWFPLYAVADVPAAVGSLGVRRVFIDPTDASNILVASEEGIIRSRDGGFTWSDLNEGLDTLDVWSLEIAEDGSVYAGTNGYGVYLLDEANGTWTDLERLFGIGRWAAWERRLYQYSALMFDPDEEGRIYLGHFPGGFFVSEDDGASWRTAGLGLGNDGIFSLTYHPDDHDTFLAGTYNGIWRSDDRGETWYNASAGMPGEQWPFSVVIDDENTSIMYTATKNGQNKGFMERNTFGGIVMKSTNGGASWFPIMKGLVNMSEYYQLIIHPDDHDVLFVSSTHGVFISRDAGGSWGPFNDGMPTSEHYVRDNVAENMMMTSDRSHLMLCIVGYGVWRVDISLLLETDNV